MLDYQTVNAGDKVTLDGSGSKDPDGSITSYSWRQNSWALAAKLSHSNTMNPSFIAPNVSANMQLRFALTLQTIKEPTSITPGIVTITIKHINHAPIVKCWYYQTVSPRDIATLDGTDHYDLDNDHINYSWIQTEGPHVILRNRANTSIATFTSSV